MSALQLFNAPSSLLLPLETGETWEVTNAEGAGFGTMSLRSATVHSVNTVYAQAIDRLGPDTAIEVAERMGLRCCRRVSNPRRPLKPFLSAVLGTNEVNTLEMARPTARSRPVGSTPSRSPCRASPTLAATSCGRPTRPEARPGIRRSPP